MKLGGEELYHLVVKSVVWLDARFGEDHDGFGHDTVKCVARPSYE